MLASLSSQEVFFFSNWGLWSLGPFFFFRKGCLICFLINTDNEPLFCFLEKKCIQRSFSKRVLLPNPGALKIWSMDSLLFLGPHTSFSWQHITMISACHMFNFSLPTLHSPSISLSRQNSSLECCANFSRRPAKDPPKTYSKNPPSICQTPKPQPHPLVCAPLPSTHDRCFSLYTILIELASFFFLRLARPPDYFTQFAKFLGVWKKGLSYLASSCYF